MPHSHSGTLCALYLTEVKGDIMKSVFTTKAAFTFTFYCGLATVLSVPAAIAQTVEKPTSGAGPALAFVGASVYLAASADKPASLQQATVLVEQGVVTKLQAAGQPIPAKYQQIDVTGQYLLPGLIDGHVHLAQSGSAFTRPDMIDATAIQTYATDQQWLSAQLPEMLRSYTRLGITTVVDLGGPSGRLARYHSLSQQQQLPAIISAAELLAPISVLQLETKSEKTFLQVDTASQATAAVQQQIAQGVAVVKIVWSDETGLSDAALTALYQQAIDTAKAAGKTVAVHVEKLASAKQAIRAGVDILVHGVVNQTIDAEFIALAKQYGVSYQPTLTAYQHYGEVFRGTLSFTAFEQHLSPPETVASFQTLNQQLAKTGEMMQIFRRYMPYVDAPAKKMVELSAAEQDIVQQLGQVFSQKMAKVQQQNLRLALQAGLNVAFGTDAGNPGTLHAASVPEEMQAWRQAGANNADILRAMTLGNAKAFKLEQRLGSISPGKEASFVVHKDNPLQENFRLNMPVMVLLRGHLQ